MVLWKLKNNTNFFFLKKKVRGICNNSFDGYGWILYHTVSNEYLFVYISKP